MVVSAPRTRVPPCVRNTCSKDVKLASNSAPAPMATQGAPGPPFVLTCHRVTGSRGRCTVPRRPRSGRATARHGEASPRSWRFRDEGAHARPRPATNQPPNQSEDSTDRAASLSSGAAWDRDQGACTDWKHRGHKPNTASVNAPWSAAPSCAPHRIGSGRLRRRSRLASITGCAAQGS